jgi:hypothetical protein
MTKKILAIVAFALLCCGSVVLAGQNTNSSTTMQPNHMNNGSMSGRRHHRHGHRKHWRHRHGRMGNKNANT